MTRPMSEEREEALEAARRIVDRSYPFGRRQLANDADLVAHALLSTSSPRAEFDRILAARNKAYAALSSKGEG